MNIPLKKRSYENLEFNYKLLICLGIQLHIFSLGIYLATLKY